MGCGAAHYTKISEILYLDSPFVLYLRFKGIYRCYTTGGSKTFKVFKTLKV
jgi:hypothetical protein